MNSSVLKLKGICAEKLLELIREKKLYADVKEYKDRLDHEIDVIASLHYEDIFLITRQIISNAISNGVIVGPGRGSAAGSMVCYLSGITRGVDPIRFNLRFERFLNHSRVTSADIDVDFSDRDVPINFLKKVYGENKVIQVGTKSLFKIKSALDEFARIFDIPFDEAKRITSCYDVDGAPIDEASLNAYRSKYPDLFEVAEFFGASSRYRNPSKHASAVIVVDEPVGRLIPLQSVEDSKTKERILTTEWDGDELDAIGYTKFDILKVTALKVIDETVRLVNKKKPGTLPKATEIFEWVDLEDKKTIDLANRADVVGVFQLWKPECVKMFERLTIKSFEDFVLITTVIRPGIDREEFIQCHESPEKIKFVIPELRPILKDTYGIILFQEQIMDICNRIAGFSMIESDNIRKAIAKLSDKKDLLSYTDKFISGCVQNNVRKIDAEIIWEEILKRQRYGFNRSHAVSYSLISFVTAYLKAHYPLEFLCACLNDKNEPRFIHEIQKHGFSILPPDVNKSGSDFTIEENSVRIGLSAIKGIGVNAEKIEKMRPYYSKDDFVSRVKPSSDVVSALQNIGALDCFVDIDSFNDEKKKFSENLRFAFEKDLLGYYVSGNPLSRYSNFLKGCIVDSKCSQKRVSIGGSASRLKVITTRKTGDEMAFVSLQSLQDEFEVVIWPSDWKLVASKMNIGKIIKANGVITEKGNYSIKDIVVHE